MSSTEHQMCTWQWGDACQTVARLGLHGPNATVAEYWLASWSSGRPPTKARFDPKRLSAQLPAIAMMSARKDGPVIFRLAGNSLRLAVGFELTGRDLLKLSPQSEVKELSRSIDELLAGGIFCGHRRITRSGGRVELVQEIALPFADVAEDGSRHYLMHSNFRPDGAEHILDGSVRADCSLAAQRTTLPIGTGHASGRGQTT